MDESERAASTEISGREKQLANLAPPWPKGVSGNPKGKPKNPYKDAIDAALPPEEFAEIVQARCRRGDSRIIAAVMDRHYPRPEVSIKLEATGADGSPLVPPVTIVTSIEQATQIGVALSQMGAAVTPKRLNGGANGNGSAHVDGDAEEGGG